MENRIRKLEKFKDDFSKLNAIFNVDLDRLEYDNDKFIESIIKLSSDHPEDKDMTNFVISVTSDMKDRQNKFNRKIITYCNDVERNRTKMLNLVIDELDKLKNEVNVKKPFFSIKELNTKDIKFFTITIIIFSLIGLMAFVPESIDGLVKSLKHLENLK